MPRVGKPYSTDRHHRLDAVTGPRGRSGVEALSGLWDADGGRAWLGRERGRLYRLPGVGLDHVQIWVPLAWTEPRGQYRRTVRLPLPCGLDVGRAGRGWSADGRPVVATVYALRTHYDAEAGGVTLAVDVDGGTMTVAS